jgi:hypothetical protein
MIVFCPICYSYCDHVFVSRAFEWILIFRFLVVSGCKIKALRAKTNTYIKTPVRGEEPVFVVTGRKEDVAAAKREILSAAEHFSQIRASRRSGLVGQGLTGTTGLVPPPPVPGQVTIQVSLLILLVDQQLFVFCRDSSKCCRL